MHRDWDILTTYICHRNAIARGMMGLNCEQRQITFVYSEQSGDFSTKHVSYDSLKHWNLESFLKYLYIQQFYGENPEQREISGFICFIVRITNGAYLKFPENYRDLPQTTKIVGCLWSILKSERGWLVIECCVEQTHQQINNNVIRNLPEFKGYLKEVAVTHNTELGANIRSVYKPHYFLKRNIISLLTFQLYI